MLNISEEKQLLLKLINFIGALGVVGERRNIALVSLTFASRLNMPDSSGQHTFGVKLSGAPGSGKSHTLDRCKMVQHPSTYFSISTASDKSLFYSSDSLKHKALVFTEALDLQKKTDSGLAYTVRTLLSEGEATHQVTMKAKGGFKTKMIEIQGPISLLTTTAVEALERQMESRIITINPDESSRQTKKINFKTAEIAENGTAPASKESMKEWQNFHRDLKPALVIIPFATDIHKKMENGTFLPIAARRSFKRFLALVKTVAVFYQHQRDKDEEQRILANYPDYHLAYQITARNFEEGILNHGDTVRERLNFIQNSSSPLRIKSLEKQWEITKAAVSKILKSMMSDGVVSWCDSNGQPFETEADLKKAKHSGRAFVTGKPQEGQSFGMLLPTTYDLTGDQSWKESGEMAELYDLALD